MKRIGEILIKRNKALPQPSLNGLRLLRITLIIFIVLISSSAPAQAALEKEYSSRLFLSEYVQTLYDEDSVISARAVKSVLQTSDGYLWLGGYQGLMRYNGIETKTFTPEDGFPSFSVNILYEDAKKRMWIGTNDRGIVLYKKNEKNVFTVYGIEQGLPSASVRGISEDESGNIYVSTTGGVAIISPEETLTVHPELDGAFTAHIEYIGGGRFLCMLNDGRIVLLDGRKVIQTFAADHFGAAQPRSMFLSSGGALYIGTVDDTVYVTDTGLSRHTAIAVSPLHTHNDFFEDSTGRIWICADNGIGFVANSANNEFTLVEGLLMSSRIECVYEDYEGSFWIGSARSLGLLQLTRGKFKNISFISSLPNYIVNTTAVFKGELYLGTDNGLVILRDYAPVQNGLTEMLEGIRVRSIFIDSKEQMWICTFEKYGVLLLKQDGSIVSFNVDNGLTGNRVRCIMEAKNGDVYVGMTGGVNVIRDEKVVKSYTRNNGLANDVILSLCEGKDGVIYAGSDGGGIYAIDGDNITNYSEKDGLASGIVLRMSFIGDGIWISTGNAICYMDGTGIRIIEKLTLYNENVFDIKGVGDEIWFLQLNGVNIYNIRNLLSDDDLKIKQLQRRDGLSSPITANSWNALYDGVLYICTSSGTFSIDTRAFHQNEAVPYARISEIFADGKPVLEADGAVTLGSRVQRVDIYLSLLSFASTEGTVSYMLEGFDNEITTDKRRDTSWVRYTNLYGGKYTFRLHGTNADGLQSETAVLTIYKEYALLEMPFVRMLLGLLGIIAIVLCFRFFYSQRTKTILRQRQEYKEITGQIMSVAASMVGYKEESMREHSRRVADYSKMIGQRLGMTENELETLYYAAMLHDIGKISIPDSIINKSGQLTKEEYDIVKGHVTVGGDLLRDISVMGDIAMGAKYHHERVDGNGYNEGLNGDEIPLSVKIISVCNAFDSMLSDKPYKKGMSVEKAQSEFIANVGTQFDEQITAVLISLINEGEVPI